MATPLDIAAAVRRTGLTSRTLRYYEARGLLAPLRTASGRRLYDVAALGRIGRIVALKRAGLTLAQIERLLARGVPDLARLVDVQLAALAVRQAETMVAMRRLIRAGERLQRGETLDVDALCDLIREGEAPEAERARHQAAVRDLCDEGAEEEASASPVERMEAALAEVDPAALRDGMATLTARIDAALPLDFDSPLAASLFDEYRRLIGPLQQGMQAAFAEPHAEGEPVKAGLAAARVDAWNSDARTPISPGAFQFLFAMSRRAEREGSA